MSNSPRRTRRKKARAKAKRLNNAVAMNEALLHPNTMTVDQMVRELAEQTAFTKEKIAHHILMKYYRGHYHKQ